MIRTAFEMNRADLGKTKRGLLLRDGLTFLTLMAATVALFGVTWFLFRSFESRRAGLAVEWTQRGRAALQQGKPDDAISALRAALSYAPEDETNQLLLAQTLANSGRTQEAESYFNDLRDARPGDGLINLQLARIARHDGRRLAAEEDYRISISGDWPGDSSTRRDAIRAELDDYEKSLAQAAPRP